MKEGSVPGVFGIDVDLAREERGADDLGGPERHPFFDRNALMLQHERDHLAEQGSFGINLRCDDDRLPGLGESPRQDQPGYRGRCARKTESRHSAAQQS